MSAEKLYTGRELAEAERRAFVHGLDVRATLPERWDGNAAEAARRYPLPTVTRPRVVQDAQGVLWRVQLGKGDTVLVEYTERGIPDWRDFNSLRAGAPGISRERVALWADLLARPTEEVEAE